MAKRVTYFMEIQYGNGAVKAFQCSPTIIEGDNDFMLAIQNQMGVILAAQQVIDPDAKFLQWWSQDDHGEKLDISDELVIVV